MAAPIRSATFGLAQPADGWEDGRCDGSQSPSSTGGRGRPACRDRPSPLRGARCPSAPAV